MNYLLEFLPDPYLKDMADYFASEHPPLPAPATPVVSQQVLARGELLAMKGDPAHQIPACANCHGPALTGMEPAFPDCSACVQLYQRAAWRMALRHADGQGSRLHADRCGTSDGRRRQGVGRVAREPTGARESPPVPQGSLPMPFRLRQRTELRGTP